MKRKLGFLMTLVIALCTSSAWAQSVVSVGTNLDFSDGTPVDNGICTYAKDMESNGTTYSQMLEVTGWTIEGENGDARAAGLFAYGSGYWLGSKENIAPATNPEGAAEGNALGVVAVWDAVAQYVQPVTLEAGNYVINIPVYNSVGGTTAPAKSLIGFIADNGTEYLAPAKAYAVNAWTVETITFTLTETTTGKLSLGYDAPNSGSGANQHLFFDKVEIMAVTETDLARADLDAVIATAQATVDAKAGVGAGLFMYSEEAYNTYAAAVAAAKAVSENAEATKDDLVAALAALNAATEAYVVTAPAADAVYTLKFNGTENYLTIGESNITIEATDDPLSFEAVGNGKYYIHDKEGKYLSYAGTNKWTMTASADVKDEWAVSVNAEGLYTLTGKNGGLGVDGTEAGSSCYGDKNGAAVALWAIAEIVIEEEPIVDPNDYTSYIVNADLSTTDAWNAEGTKGISGGMVKVGSQAVYDFSQTITLPAGQYKMTAKAVYRYGDNEQAEYDAIQAGTDTHKAKLYAETATKKYEANVQNRYEGASDTDYAAGNGSVTINGKFVPNSSAAVQAWFNADQYVNELVFNVYEDGQVKIGITTVDGIAGDYGNIGAWTLTRLGDAVEDTPAEPELIVWNINPADYTAGTQYAIDEAHVVNDTLTIYTTQMHWTTQLRVYSSSEHNGFFYSNKLPAAIKSIEFTAGNKVDVLVVYGSNDGATWTEAAKVEVSSTSYTSGLVADLTGTAYNYFKVDVEGNQQIRISNLIITLDPSVELPKVVSAPSFSLSGCNLFAPATVELTAAEGTIYWSTDNENFVAYTDAIAIDATCTIYAYAEVDGSKSAVASAEYVMATTYDNVAALLAAEATSAGVPVVVKLNAVVDSLGLNKNGEVTSAFLVEGTDTLMIYDYNIPADYVVGNVVKGQLAGLWKDYKGTLELCNVDYSGATASEPTAPEAPALDGTYFSVSTAATTLELEKWYLLKNQGRNAYINDLATELRMKGAAELSNVNSTDANKGLFFKLAAGSAEGTYTIVSGNGNYFTIANSGSAVSATAVDYIIGNVAEGVFYMQDPATSVVADGNAAGGTFVGWGTTVPTSAGGNNCYQFMQVDFIDAATAEVFVNASNMLYDLQVAYGLVTDASQFSSNAPETSEGSLGALIDNQYGTFFHSAWSYTVEEAHYLQMEVSEPTESIFFYFKKRSQNNNNRPTDITILGSNDGEVFTEITTINSGLPTGASPLDYTSEVITASEAYKHFRFVVNATSNGTKFFTFSEFYLFPGNQTILDAIATSKALVEAGIGAENFDELKAAFETAYNKVQEDKFNKLFNTAVADAEALLAAASHAEAPALGQYSTAAYTEFEAALATLKAEATQENLDAINAAVVKFEAAKCLPVFTINGVIDYAAGKSIYENAEGGLNFKATDLADEAMLWSFDMTETAVGITEKVVVKNLATGNLFWGAPSIKVTETSDAVEGTDDGIFLFYTEGNGTPVHAQNNGQAVVRWSSTEATSGSAWAFTFVGTTYDLYDLDAPDWTDITAETITNADFASNVDGWTKTDAGFAYEARVAEFYSGWGSLENTSGSLLQEVTLPAGKYRLTGKAFFRQGESYGTNPAKSLGYMVAGDNKVLVKTLGSVEGLNAYANSRVEAANAFYTDGLYDNVLEFTLAEETTLNIGFETTFDEMRSWFIVGEVKLESAQPVPGALFPLFEEQAMAFCSYNNMAMYSLSGVLSRWEELTNVVNEIYGAITSGEKVLDAKVVNTMDAMTAMLAELEEINEFYAEFNEIKFNCYDIQDNSVANTPEVAAAFEDVVSLSYNTAGIATLADLQALADTLLYASRQYVLNAVPNEGFTFDYTFLIEGVGNSTDGWVNDVPGFSGNFVYKHSTEKDTETLKKNGFIEAWNPSAYTGTISYTKNELPNGYYKISAYAFTNGTTTFFANADSVIVENTSMYVQPVIDSVLVTDGTLKFGLAVENANWVGITNVTLAFVAPAPAVEPVGKKVVYNLDVERVAGLGYAAEEYTIATSELAALLGVESLGEATMWGVNPDGSYVADAMTVYDGWRAVDGTFAGWSSETAAVCVKLFAEEAAYLISICTHGDNGNDPAAGTQSTAVWALVAGIDTVVINTNITFIEPAIINIADYEVVSTITVKHVEEVGVAFSGNTASFDAAAVAAALGVTSLADAEQYILNVTTGNLVVNSTDGWRNSQGDATAWANLDEGSVCVKINDPASGTIDYIGCYDATFEVGEVYTAKWAFVHEGKAVVIEVVITFDIPFGIDNIETTEDAVIYTITGKRVQGNVKSLESGIYIVNGRKVLVK